MIKIEEKYDFNSIDKKIMEANSNIERNIKKFSNDDRGFLSQNLLNALRTFVEYIAVKIYLTGKTETINYDNGTVRIALDYIKSRGKIKFIERFHYYLQISRSHYIENDDSAERLMLKYYKYLILLKDYMKILYNIDILNNITDFPLDLDSTFSDYYKKVADVIKKVPTNTSDQFSGDKYYVQKLKTFFVNGKIYYEVTLSPAKDKVNKYDKIIAFTRMHIMPNYSIKLSIVKAKVNILGRDMAINIINNWSVAIRECEINNFYKVFGINKKYKANNKEYTEVMSLLTKAQYSLLDLATINDIYYDKIKEKIKSNSTTTGILDLIDNCRYYIKNNSKGHVVLRYLLYNCNNRIIKDQLALDSCSILSNLYLQFGCIPFEEMPYASSLINHNPTIYDLIDIVPIEGRSDELLAGYIKKNTEQNNKLYTSIDEVRKFGDIHTLVNSYNNKIYYKHKPNRCLVIENNNLYIHGYEDDTINIINKLNSLTNHGIRGYKASFQSFINQRNYLINCQEKENILLNMYENSTVALIYGAAGTGKTTLIKHLTYFYSNERKICLANTNSAVENLKSNVNNQNADFMTVHKFISESNNNTECDILIIDECSTISNSDMRQILEKANFSAILLAGDIYQIESITFGNWFTLSKKLVNPTSVFELNFTWRSTKQELLDLWELVRNGDDRVDEMLVKKEFSEEISEEIFKKQDEDEIILCLNYDGLYGINSINYYLQNENKNKSIVLDLGTYKVGDPIIFGDTNRFSPVIYNNLKGKIVDIEEDEFRFWFSVEIDKVINELEIQFLDLELVGESENNKSIVKFYVNKYRNADEDNDSDLATIVPFSVAYAVSIHKSQGLEYNSVKIIITNEIDELITHSIFYTSITRAKEKLKIYWSPECQNKIISTIKHIEDNKDVNLIKNKINSI